MNNQSEMIKQALARAIANTSNTTLQAAVTTQRSEPAIENQFPPIGPFVRSTW